ncbi:MAG: hypothetical protein AABZ60_11150 [Planctomycetota bacterium]
MNLFCREFQEEMGAYVYETPPQKLTQHLSECRDCQKHFQELETLKTELKQASQSPSIEAIEALQHQLYRELDWKKSYSAPPRFSWFSRVAAILFFVLGFWMGTQKTNLLPERTSSEKQTSIVPTKSSSLKEMLPLSKNWLTLEGLKYLNSGTQTLKKN